MAPEWRKPLILLGRFRKAAVVPTEAVAWFDGVGESGGMVLRHKICRKDGKEHRNRSVVENRRFRGGRVVQRQVLYLGGSTTAGALRGRARSRHLMTAGR